MRRSTFALLAALLAVAPISAEQMPSRTRGHSADSIYQVGDLDNINLFNGNLTIGIPIGQSYSVSPQLSYRLSLAYNSSVWDYEDLLSCLGDNNKPQPYNFPYPTPHCNAGVGWSLHLGRLFAPNDAIYNKHNPNWLYVGPDGSQHNLYPELHPNEMITANVFYSNDGTYLRLDARVPSLVKVESQDGLVRTFAREFGRYRLTETADRFGNWMRITYDGLTWEITDSHGRSHTVTLNGAGDVTEVELEAFGGGTATYELTYVTASLERHRFDYPCTANSGPHPLHTEFVSASLLSAVEQPDGSSFAFTYDTIDNTFSGYSGAIRSMVVPTGGRFEWDYWDYLFQSQAPTLPESTLTLQRGVGARRTYLQASGGTVQGSWTYEQSASFEITLPGSPFQVACWHRMRVSDNLSRQVTESYFATVGGPGWVYGLPYAPCDPVTASTTPVAWSASNDNPYLSTRVYERQANGSLLPIRSTYVIYDTDGRDSGNHQDRNHRLRYQKVVYHDDLDGSGNPHTEETINSDFDGLGHYRKVNRKSSFGPEKEVTTSYLPLGSYQLHPDTATAITDTFDVPNIASPWIHGLSSGSSIKQGSLESKRETCFDSTTGFLERQRLLAGADQLGKDVIVAFEEGDDTDGDGGFVVAERVYGGDAANLPSGSLCDLSLPTASYVKKNGYRYGSLNRSAWVEPCNELDVILVTEEAEIDQSTGLPEKVIEPNGLEVQLEYDNMGRLLAEVPQQGASRVHKYVVSPPSYEIRHCPQGTSNFCLVAHRLSDRYWSYDALGRMASKALAYPGENGDADPSVTYEIDGIGRKTEESTWGGDHKTEFEDFDVFGRARSIEPDGTHPTLLSFRGERIKAREVKIATGIDTTSSVFATEVHDHHGRLVAVCEAATAVWSGTGSCAGQLTRYTYDQEDRLIQVCQNVHPTNGSCGQQRFFGWDGRGFMTSETHPEIGAFGNGTISYLRDARGNTTQRDVSNDTGDRPLRFAYDRAGRPIRADEQISTGWRPLKEFFYARANQPGSSEKRRGQLIMARRTNWVELINPLPVEVANVPLMVTDHYEYFGLGGRASKKTTSVSLPSGSQSFSTSFSYGLLGDIALIDYPRGDWPHQSAPARQVSFERDLGFLTTVPGFASSITYQLGGMIYEIDYPNGVKWRQTSEDVTGWERPDQIETLNVASAGSWSTGDYSYDGAGNISAIGDRKYVYDAFSRFSYVQRTGQPQRDQKATYDAYGNLTELVKSGNTRVLTTNAATNRLATQEAAYTSNGELAYAVLDGLDFAYGYDGLGQQLFQQTPAKTWVYAYDANDERVLAWECAGNRCGENTNFERYTLRGLEGEVLRVFAGPSRAELAWQEDFVYRDGQPLGWVKAEPTGGESRLFLHADHLGSTRQVTNAAGQQVSRHDFLPFGEESTASSSGDIKLKFTGHERDQPGRPMDYMHARSVSPLLGRFLRVDPSGTSARPTSPQTWNRFTYVENNPLRLVDPDGQNPVLIWTRAKHFIQRHVKKDQYTHKSKFKTNDPEQAKKVIEKTVGRYDSREIQEDGRVAYRKRFNKGPGKDGEQDVRVITEPVGGNKEKVITAYPTKLLVELFPGVATFLFGKEIVEGAANMAAEELAERVRSSEAAERNRKLEEMILQIDSGQ